MSIGFGNAGSLVTLIRTVSWSGGDEGEVRIRERTGERKIELSSTGNLSKSSQ